MEDLIAQMRREAGILPGKFNDMFKGLFNPKVKQLLTPKDMESLKQFSLDKCAREEKCKPILLNASSFLARMEFLFQRPFPRLGTLHSLFEDKIFIPGKKEL